MPLIVHTARVSYGGADRLDITRASADRHRRETGAAHPGEPFAPSWDILGPALEHRDTVRQFCSANAAVAATLEHAAWRLYAAAFAHEMRASYRRDRAAWDDLLARASVTLVCFCADPARCHRTLVARMLAKLGATNAGEVRDG